MAVADVEVIVEHEHFPMHSQVLALASPVFAAMLQSGMQEGQTKRIVLEGKSKAEFEVFCSFMSPFAGRRAQINPENVDFLLQWFDEYQALSMKDECEELLLSMPCDTKRLMQAAKFGLSKQYNRCLEAVAKNFYTMPIETLAECPDICRDLLPLMQKHAEADAAKAAQVPKVAAQKAQQIAGHIEALKQHIVSAIDEHKTIRAARPAATSRLSVSSDSPYGRIGSRFEMANARASPYHPYSTEISAKQFLIETLTEIEKHVQAIKQLWSSTEKVP
eukprot:gnl/TRDRNA2_/TRDRNA2_146583_c0_seq1.p1 gnl/TRDRNA2_/TRDRNA2_146583_c0~~gnl/TRDRNA2_/TRDRNA2_146583_c0_seq1.p1  ORF type:complete len:283 (+),score=66.63 gnl/TRDRNA2_/TRDRNA2_146583_c0_seq1:23-850(+)